MSDDGLIEVRCKGVSRRYADGTRTVTALDGFTDTFHSGETVAVTGPSGSGKSTLLGLLAALDYADDGTIHLGETELGSLSTVEQTQLRAERISYLGSEHNLLPILSVYENISLALSLKRLAEAEIDRRIRENLRRVDLWDLAYRRPAELSSGERARAAIARALASDNPVLIADEPTAHLDAEDAERIARLLAAAASDGRHLVIFATHDPVVASYADRTVRLRSDARSPERGSA